MVGNLVGAEYPMTTILTVANDPQFYQMCEFDNPKLFVPKLIQESKDFFDRAANGGIIFDTLDKSKSTLRWWINAAKKAGKSLHSAYGPDQFRIDLNEHHAVSIAASEKALFITEYSHGTTSASRVFGYIDISDIPLTRQEAKNLHVDIKGEIKTIDDVIDGLTYKGRKIKLLPVFNTRAEFKNFIKNNWN